MKGARTMMSHYKILEIWRLTKLSFRCMRWKIDFDVTKWRNLSQWLQEKNRRGWRIQNEIVVHLISQLQKLSGLPAYKVNCALQVLHMMKFRVRKSLHIGLVSMVHRCTNVIFSNSNHLTERECQPRLFSQKEAHESFRAVPGIQGGQMQILTKSFAWLQDSNIF